ncbi:hypothetical protein CICLE_v10003254mg, partial [Citrus x clementina]
GTDDDVVNWFHGNKLWKMARDLLEPLWIKGGGHYNLALYPDYIHHLCWFCRIKCCRPKCPECPKLSRTKCCWKPKCPKCWIPSCVNCCRWPK